LKKLKSYNSSFNDAFKGFLIFGSTQIVLTIVALIKTKFVAIYIGIEGVGIHSILNSNANLFTSLCGVGVATASISYFSKSKDFKNLFNNLFTIITFFGLIGVTLLILFSEELSYLFFDDPSFQNQIIIISLIIFFSNFTNLKKSLLQSLGKRKSLSISSILSSILGLSTIIIYAYAGKDGIAYALILSSLIAFFVFLFIKPLIFKLEFKKTIYYLKENKRILSLGVALVFSGFYFQMLSNILNIIIVKNGMLSDVGQFQASLSITNQAVGLIFTALALDYFPRLSSSIDDPEKVAKVVRNQISLVLIFIGPLLGCLIVFIRPLIKILLTEEFLQITLLSSLLLFSMLFKSIQWCLGYILIAEGKSKKYLRTEIIGITIFFLIVIISYLHKGIIGLGFGYIYAYIFYLIYYIFITFEISKNIFNKKILVHFIIILAFASTLLITEFFEFRQIFSYLIKIILLLFLIIYSFKQFQINSKQTN